MEEINFLLSEIRKYIEIALHQEYNNPVDVNMLSAIQKNFYNIEVTLNCKYFQNHMYSKPLEYYFNTLHLRGEHLLQSLSKINSSNFNFIQIDQMLYMLNEELRMSFTQPIFEDVITFLKEHNIPIINDLPNEKDVIGRGSNSVVYKCYYEPRHELVAVKQATDSQLAPYNLARFLNEILTLNQFKMHSNFLSFYGCSFQIPNTISVVTNIANNGDLEKLLNNRNSIKLTPTQLTIIALGIAHAINELHLNKKVHRDIKAENVLLDEKLHPILSDFGFTADCDTMKTNPIGTPIYIAPEVFTGHYDQKCDVYSYGVLLYYLSEEESIPCDYNIENANEQVNYLKKTIFSSNLYQIHKNSCKDDDIFNAPANLARMFQDLIDRDGNDAEDDFEFMDPKAKKSNSGNDRIPDLVKRCTQYFPVLRPSMGEIVDLFLNGECVFPGTKMEDVLSYYDYISHPQEETFTVTEQIEVPIKMPATAAQAISGSVVGPILPSNPTLEQILDKKFLINLSSTKLQTVHMCLEACIKAVESDEFSQLPDEKKSESANLIITNILKNFKNFQSGISELLAIANGSMKFIRICINNNIDFQNVMDDVISSLFMATSYKEIARDSSNLFIEIIDKFPNALSDHFYVSDKKVFTESTYLCLYKVLQKVHSLPYFYDLCQIVNPILIHHLSSNMAKLAAFCLTYTAKYSKQTDEIIDFIFSSIGNDDLVQVAFSLASVICQADCESARKLVSNSDFISKSAKLLENEKFYKSRSIFAVLSSTYPAVFTKYTHIFLQRPAENLAFLANVAQTTASAKAIARNINTIAKIVQNTEDDAVFNRAILVLHRVVMNNAAIQEIKIGQSNVLIQVLVSQFINNHSFEAAEMIDRLLGFGIIKKVNDFVGFRQEVMKIANQLKGRASKERILLVRLLSRL